MCITAHVGACDWEYHYWVWCCQIVTKYFKSSRCRHIGTCDLRVSLPCSAVAILKIEIKIAFFCRMESELNLSLCVTERSIFVTEIKAQLARRHVALALDRPCNRRLFLFCSYACASIDTSVWFCASKMHIAVGYKKSEGNLWLSINPESSQHYIHSFNGPLSGTTRVSWYKKGKTSLDFTEAEDSEWQWYQLGHMQVCTSLHASTPPLSFLQAGCPSCQPNQQHQSTEGTTVL